MRTALLLLSWIAAATAQTELSQARVAADKALREMGADAAEPHWARIEAILPALPPDSMEHAGVAGFLVDDLVHAGQDIRAFRILDETFARMSHLPDSHPAMLRLLDWKAGVLRRSQRYRQSAEVRERTLAARLASDPASLSKAKYDLASDYRLAGMHEKAIPILRELRDLPPGLLGPDPNAMLANSLIELRRFAEAESLVRERIDQADTEQSKELWRYSLGRLYFQEGRIGEAKELGYDGSAPRIWICGSRHLGGAPDNGSAGEVTLRLHAHLARAGDLTGYAKLNRVGDVVIMIQQLSRTQPAAVGPLIEPVARVLADAHLLGGPHRVDHIWNGLIDAASRGGMANTAERLVLRQIALIEKYRGKDSPSLDRPKDLLAAIRRGEPAR